MAICASACTNKIKVSNFKITFGFKTGPQKGLFGTKGKAIKSKASRKIPSRNSASVIHWLAIPCIDCLAIKIAVMMTAKLAANEIFQIQRAPMK
ncbi:hypothetical protein D3C71_1086640 [compost metagenome]